MLAAAAALGFPSACDRGDSPSTNDSARADRGIVPPPAAPPQYSFAPGVREQHPDVAGFVQEFLLTCLSGDYTGYRMLVSRSRNPESEERFGAIYQAIRRVEVRSIEPLELRGLPPPAYRVVTKVEFRPQEGKRGRDLPSDIAILVFREDGQWRMIPAPSELQPEDEPPATTSGPAPSSAPHYPWDEDGDY